MVTNRTQKDRMAECMDGLELEADADAGYVRVVLTCECGRRYSGEIRLERRHTYMETGGWSAQDDAELEAFANSLSKAICQHGILERTCLECWRERKAARKRAVRPTRCDHGILLNECATCLAEGGLSNE